jgi:type IV secretory pathway VirB10-like protein
MSRANPKVLVLIAAVLTVALLAFVFAGDNSSGDRLPPDRLTDEQAGMTVPEPVAQSEETSADVTDGEEDQQARASPPPPPPEPEVEPGPVLRPTPIVRPAPPAQPRRSTKSESGDAAASRAKARADAERLSQPARAKRPTAPAGQRTATARPPAATGTPIARPSYNCRYARTRSEVAVCSDAGLARLDQQMAAQFNNAFRQGTPAQREVLERSRLRFLYRRDRCQSASCIADVYRARMSEINDIAARNWRAP